MDPCIWNRFRGLEGADRLGSDLVHEVLPRVLKDVFRVLRDKERTHGYVNSNADQDTTMAALGLPRMHCR